MRQLEQEPSAISLPDLLRKLGHSFKERSVRRWLNALVEEGVVEKKGQKKGTKYSIPKRSEEGRVSTTCFSSTSQEIIAFLRKPLFERHPLAYNEQWFDSYQPNKDFYLPTSLRQQLLKAGQRAHAHDPAGTYAHQIFNRLLIDLSYNSSRLEGNTYSLLDTERLLLQGNDAEGKLDEEKIMILNHKEAIRYLVDNASKLEINHHVICTLHFLLADGLMEPTDAGKVRRHRVRVGGSVYMPFEDPKRLEQQLEKITFKAAAIKDPFEQSFFLLVHISYLQAFADVNKRTARLAANIALIKNNLVPLAFNDIATADYMSAMIAIYELQNVRPLVDLYIYSYLRTCTAYDATIHAMGFDAVRVRYRQERRSLIREIILSHKTGKALAQYIQHETTQLIPQIDQQSFIEDLHEDLHLIDESRLAGLGITPEQLKQWISNCSQSA